MVYKDLSGEEVLAESELQKVLVGMTGMKQYLWSDFQRNYFYSVQDWTGKNRKLFALSEYFDNSLKLFEGKASEHPEFVPLPENMTRIELIQVSDKEIERALSRKGIDFPFWMEAGQKKELLFCGWEKVDLSIKKEMLRKWEEMGKNPEFLQVKRQEVVQAI